MSHAKGMGYLLKIDSCPNSRDKMQMMSKEEESRARLFY
jgi:hypothetical protein